MMVPLDALNKPQVQKKQAFFYRNYSGYKVHGSGFKVKATKEGLYSSDKYPVIRFFDMSNGLEPKVQGTLCVVLEA